MTTKIGTKAGALASDNSINSIIAGIQESGSRDENGAKNNQFKNVNLDTQIKVKKQRAPKRKFSSAYKLQILNAVDACKDSADRGALLRKEGLYYARVSSWRKQLQDGKFVSNKTPKSILINQQLAREVSTLKKKLAQAEAIIDIQKKSRNCFRSASSIKK